MNSKLLISLGMVSLLALTACGKKEEEKKAPAATEQPAATPAKPAAPAKPTAAARPHARPARKKVAATAHASAPTPLPYGDASLLGD